MINVIAVDDEMDAKILFDHFFRKEVQEKLVSLEFVQSAEDCLSALANKDAKKTVVVTDINMPGTSGIQLTETINNDYPEAKVFLVSAYDAHSQVDLIKHLRIAEYITKPVDFGELKKKIISYFPKEDL